MNTRQARYGPSQVIDAVLDPGLWLPNIQIVNLE